MKISLITVCFKSAATIRQTLESVRAQKLPPGVTIDYHVVDGASPDETVAIIRDFAESLEKDNRTDFTFTWTSEPDAGMYNAINKGIARATGDLVGILNADDRFSTDDILATVAQAFQDHPEWEAVYGDVRFVRGDSDQTTRYYSSAPWRRWMHNWGFMPAHPSVYVRREIFERVGDYQTDYEIAADFEWMTRVFCRIGIRAHYLKKCMVTMRLGGKSTGSTKKMVLLNRENVRANRANGYFCCSLMMLPKYLYKIFGYRFYRK